MKNKWKKICAAACGLVLAFALSDCQQGFVNTEAKETENVSVNSVKTDDSKNETVDGYAVYRYSSDTGKWKKIRDLSSESASYFSDSTVKSGTAYIYKIKPYRFDGKKKAVVSKLCREVRFYNPPKKVNVKASVSGKSIKIKWSKTNCSGYRIYMYKNGSWKVLKYVSKNKTSCTIPNVKSSRLSLKVVPVLRTKKGKVYKSADNSVIKINMKKKKTDVYYFNSVYPYYSNGVRINLKKGTLQKINNANTPKKTYSSLASWKWSGKTDNYNVRNHKIDKITIHHQAELNKSLSETVNLLVKHYGSVNYIIDSEGKIGVMIDEKYRAWTSSSPENDMRAVTIEVANDEIGGQWHVSDKALNSLIELCTDICQRNGISKLNFTGNANGNLTMHKYFAKTVCPGPYLGSKFPYIANEVNKRLKK